MIEKIENSKKTQLILILLNVLFIFMGVFIYRIPIFIWAWPATTLLIIRHFKNKGMLTIACISVLISLLFLAHGVLGSFEGDIFFALLNFAFFMLIYFLDRWLYPVLNNRIGWGSVFLLPLLYAGLFNIEHIFSATAIPFGAFQYNMPLLIQSASLIGMQGLNFVVMLFATVAVYVLENWGSPKKYRPIMIAYIVLIICLFLYGDAKLSWDMHKPDDTVRVGMALTPQDCDFTSDENNVSYDESLNFVNCRIEEAAKAGAKIICFGEESVFVYPSQKDDFLNSVAQTTKKNNIYAIVCIESGDESDSENNLLENCLFVVSNKGEVVGRYDKSRLIPILEQPYFVKGNEKPLYLEIPYEENKILCASFIICFDSDHEAYVSTLDDKTNVLFVPSWIWDFFDPYHANIERLRAIENGVCLVNPNIGGTTTACDWNGDVFSAFNDKITGRDHVGIADVPIDSSYHKPLYHYIAVYLFYGFPTIALIFVLYSLILKIKYKKRISVKK